MSANLMIVEDGERVRGVVRPAVENEGYDVAVAENAVAAVPGPGHRLGVQR
ncbi:hypothetical protein [Nocardia sp. NPDC002869]|uniref:hypothetical protein n=1 Tax=Nocardia sp. NPDC002869 TaxID=3161032 RepID=UPI00398D3915